MLGKFRFHLLLVLAIALAGPAFADNDPSVSQVYEAARAGHLQQAQQMIDEVLRDHPKSAKAHYVAAEIHARRGDFPMARQELNIADALAPGLPFAERSSVEALQRELSRAQSARARPVESQAQSSVPWSTAAIVLIVGAFVLWLILRRRNPPTSVYSQYPGQYPAPMSPPAGVPGNPVGTGVAPSTGGGLGSAVAGGLATGLGVGAGLVAGEALAGHLLGSGEQQRNAPLPVNEPPDNASNADPGNDDMGGRDFGLSDDNSWGDDSGGLGGVDGGDDWT